MSHPLHKIISHSWSKSCGQAILNARDIEGFEVAIGCAYTDEEEYQYLQALAGRIDGMRVGEAQDAWHNTCVQLIRRSVR